MVEYLVLFPPNFLIRKTPKTKPKIDSFFSFGNFELNLVYKCATMKMEAMTKNHSLLIIHHRWLKRLIVELRVHTLTSVTVSLRTLIKQHTKRHSKM